MTQSKKVKKKGKKETCARLLQESRESRYRDIHTGKSVVPTRQCYSSHIYGRVEYYYYGDTIEYSQTPRSGSVLAGLSRHYCSKAITRKRQVLRCKNRQPPPSLRQSRARNSWTASHDISLHGLEPSENPRLTAPP